MAREAGVSKHTIYAWKVKYGGMDVSQAQEAKKLRDENTRRRKPVADPSLDKEALQFGYSKKRLELVALKTAVGQIRAEYAFRRACGLLIIRVHLSNTLRTEVVYNAFFLKRVPEFS